MKDQTTESERLLSELQSLNTTLDNDPYDLDADQQLEDLPVLKSFVEKVPVLSERFMHRGGINIQPQTIPPQAIPAEPAAEEGSPAIVGAVKQQVVILADEGPGFVLDNAKNYLDEASAELHSRLTASRNDPLLAEKAASVLDDIVKNQLALIEAELRTRLEADAEALINAQKEK